MGRHIFYSENINNILTDIIKTSHVDVGLLIGHCLPNRDLVIHACPCPPQDSQVEQAEGDKKPTKPSSVTKLESLLNQEWISQHAKQVIRMLTGGIDVLGIYIVAPQDSFKKNQAVCKEILSSMFKLLSKYQSVSTVSEVTERPLLHICPSSKKFTCFTFDVADNKSILKPAEWKPLPNSNRERISWVRLDSRLTLDHRFRVLARHSASTSLLRQLEISIAPLFRSLLYGPGLIAGISRPPEELLLPDPSKADLTSPVNVTLLFSDDPENIAKHEEGRKLQVVESGAIMILQGTIQARAFVHHKATVGEALCALKQDVVRSLTARLEIQCEDLLLIDEEQQDPEVVHELPRRAHAPLLPANDGLTVCDYLFHGEKPSDAIGVFKELLNLAIPEERITIAPLENSPSLHTLFQPENLTTKPPSHPSTPISSSFQSKALYPIFGLSFLGALVSSVYYFYLKHASTSDDL